MNLGTNQMVEDIALPSVPEQIGLPCDIDNAYFGWFRVVGLFPIGTGNADLVGTFSEANDGNVNYLDTDDYRFLATHYSAVTIPLLAADLKDGNAYMVAKSLQLSWKPSGGRVTRYHPIIWAAQPTLITDGETLGSPTTTYSGVDVTVPQKFRNGPLYVNDGGKLEAIHNATLAGTCKIIENLFGVISGDNAWMDRYSKYCGSCDSGAPKVRRIARK